MTRVFLNIFRDILQFHLNILRYLQYYIVLIKFITIIIAEKCNTIFYIYKIIQYSSQFSFFHQVHIINAGVHAVFAIQGIPVKRSSNCDRLTLIFGSPSIVKQQIKNCWKKPL